MKENNIPDFRVSYYCGRTIVFLIMSSLQFIVFIILTCLKHIVNMKEQKLTKFCIHIIIDNVYGWDSNLSFFTNLQQCRRRH